VPERADEPESQASCPEKRGEGTSMADEVFTNALGGILMLLIIQGYLIYLRTKRQRGGLITRPERTIFSAMCLISFLAVLVYFVRTQVI
jgi:hypothetical protein